MINGKRNTDKMTWQEFQEWQRWDEFPELVDNPPLTVDVSFFFEKNEYYIIECYGKFHIYNAKWNVVFSHENFRTLLITPIPLFHGKSFRDVIEQLEFD